MAVLIALGNLIFIAFTFEFMISVPPEGGADWIIYLAMISSCFLALRFPLVGVRVTGERLVVTGWWRTRSFPIRTLACVGLANYAGWLTRFSTSRLLWMLTIEVREPVGGVFEPVRNRIVNCPSICGSRRRLNRILDDLERSTGSGLRSKPGFLQ